MRNMMLQVRNYKSISLLLLLFGAVGSAFAWDNCGTNIQYEIQGSILVLNSPDPTQSAVISASAFKNNTTITSVTFPENVTSIEGQAFMGCTALTDIVFPDNLTTISSYAFDSCSSLNNVVIPPAVNNIGGYAFYDCSALQSVLCRPFTAPALGTDAFTQCHTNLQICVPNLGSYNAKDSGWNYYNTKLTLCSFLDENDDENVTTNKIIDFSGSSPITEIDIVRTLRKAGCFNTLTLPFNVPDIASSPLAGAEVYVFVGATVVNNILQLDITPLTSNTLIAGTPYLIQWPNTGKVMKRLHFSGITWDTDQTADNAGTGNVLLHGFYGKTHINDATEGEQENLQHLNLFLQGNNQLYWPEGNDATSMLGFRAWFQIGNTIAGAPVRRNMPATLRIVNTPTDIESPITDNPSTTTYKELRNGQLIIIRNGETFSSNGQKL